jgi:hypothetical protein
LSKDVPQGTGWDVLAWAACDRDGSRLVGMAEDTVTAALAVEPPAIGFDPAGDIAHLHPPLFRRAQLREDADRWPRGENVRIDDQPDMTSDELLPTHAGPVPDRLTIWPVDDGRYGLDATFQGSTGYERAQQHRNELEREDVPHTFRQELDGAWTLRFGPLKAADIARALAAFVY